MPLPGWGRFGVEWLLGFEGRGASPDDRGASRLFLFHDSSTRLSGVRVFGVRAIFQIEKFLSIFFSSCPVLIRVWHVVVVGLGVDKKAM